jgi:hypothetical protein
MNRHELGRPHIIKPPMLGSAKAFTRARVQGPPNSARFWAKKQSGIYQKNRKKIMSEEESKLDELQ